MTNEEALKLLEDHEYWAEFSYFDEMAITAIEAIEKQIPKKPRETGAMYYCPNCGGLVVLTDFVTDITCNYCLKCGQALDWSEEE